MGRQSSRIYFNGKDHKDVYYNGKYHKAMYLIKPEWGCNGIIWEKLPDIPLTLTTNDIVVMYDGFRYSVIKIKDEAVSTKLTSNDAIKLIPYEIWMNNQLWMMNGNALYYALYSSGETWRPSSLNNVVIANDLMAFDNTVKCYQFDDILYPDLVGQYSVAEIPNGTVVMNNGKALLKGSQGIAELSRNSYVYASWKNDNPNDAESPCYPCDFSLNGSYLIGLHTVNGSRYSNEKMAVFNNGAFTYSNVSGIRPCWNMYGDVIAFKRQYICNGYIYAYVVEDSADAKLEIYRSNDGINYELIRSGITTINVEELGGNGVITIDVSTLFDVVEHIHLNSLGIPSIQNGIYFEKDGHLIHFDNPDLTGNSFYI